MPLVWVIIILVLAYENIYGVIKVPVKKSKLRCVLVCLILIIRLRDEGIDFGASKEAQRKLKKDK